MEIWFPERGKRKDASTPVIENGNGPINLRHIHPNSVLVSAGSFQPGIRLRVRPACGRLPKEWTREVPSRERLQQDRGGRLRSVQRVPGSEGDDEVLASGWYLRRPRISVR